MDWEIQCGIRQYMRRDVAIGGSLKYLVEDFVVNEIDKEGNLVVFDERAEEMKEVEEKKEERKEGPREYSVEKEIYTDVQRILLPDDLTRFQEFLTQINAGHTEEIYEVTSITDKPLRTEFHMLIKQHFPGLISCTNTENQVVTLRVYSSDGISSNRKKRKLNLDSRPQFKLPGKFIEFVLWKYNMESMSAVKHLAKSIGAKEKQFGMAGNKDKRGITTQKLTTFSNFLPKLRSFRNDDSVKIGHFKYTDSDIGIGDLKGNRFTIILRGISQEITHDQLLQSNLHTGIVYLSNTGFINYFGLQRFGNSQENPTHKVGLAMIRKDFKAAVERILGPRETHHIHERMARENYLIHRDPSISLDEFPRFCVIYRQHLERSILEGMAKAGGANSYSNGIMSLPRNSRTIYGHAYQSYIFNTVTSRRLEYSHSIEIGDLVVENDSVVVVNQDNIKKYTLEDVVLPLPGNKIQYPDNFTLDYYKEVLRLDDLEIDSFEDLPKELMLAGDYRKIIAKPGDLEGAEVHYMKMDDANSVDEGPIRGLQVSFSLPSSCYATMCLRELTQSSMQ